MLTANHKAQLGSIGCHLRAHLLGFPALVPACVDACPTCVSVYTYLAHWEAIRS